MEKINKVLIDAGYHRARFSSLSEFDRIIGGMAWAMQLFTYDIDIDICYADTLDLGQKIALTERLVMVVLAMNCPHPIEPHQIVGLDYDSILPVIKWLIKRSANVRDQYKAFNRLMALRYFFKVTNSNPKETKWPTELPIDQLERLENLEKEEKHEDDSRASCPDTVPLEHVKSTMSLFNKLKNDFNGTDQISILSKTPSSPEKRSSHKNGRIEGKSSEKELVAGSKFDNATSIDTNVELQRVPLSEDLNELSQNIASPEQEISFELDEGSKLERELNTELMATNQKILNLMKKLDAMPSQTESSQYQKRYIELHLQLISKNKDLKKLYDLYNSLIGSRHYLTKEIALMDSIVSNLDVVNNSSGNRAEFLRQLGGVIDKICSIRDELNRELVRKQNEFDLLTATLQSLQQDQ